jgi:hypothetical protein
MGAGWSVSASLLRLGLMGGHLELGHLNRMTYNPQLRQGFFFAPFGPGKYLVVHQALKS